MKGGETMITATAGSIAACLAFFAAPGITAAGALAMLGCKLAGLF